MSTAHPLVSIGYYQLANGLASEWELEVLSYCPFVLCHASYPDKPSIYLEEKHGNSPLPIQI